MHHRLRGPVVLALLVLELAFLAVLIVRGHREPTTRRLAIASTALRVARADAAALLDRLARAEVARASAAVARQIDDYKSLLAEGETDPVRIERIHQEREDARATADAR